MTAAHPHDAQIRRSTPRSSTAGTGAAAPRWRPGSPTTGTSSASTAATTAAGCRSPPTCGRCSAATRPPPTSAIVRSVRPMAPGVAVLLAHAGMIPPGATTSTPTFHTVHTLVAVDEGGGAGGSRCCRPPRRLAPAPRRPRGADRGTARAADPAVTVLVTAADLLTAGERVVLLDVAGRSVATGGGRRTWPVTCPARSSSTSRPSWRIRRRPTRTAPAAVDTATAVSGAALGDPRRRRRRRLRRDRRLAAAVPGGCCAGAGWPTSGCWTADWMPGWAPAAPWSPATSSRSPGT